MTSRGKKEVRDPRAHPGLGEEEKSKQNLFPKKGERGKVGGKEKEATWSTPPQTTKKKKRRRKATWHLENKAWARRSEQGEKTDQKMVTGNA